MRKILVTLLLVFTLGCVAHAQDTKPRTASGDKALMFSITGLGTFGIGGSYAGTLPVTLAGFDTLFDDFGIRVAAPLYGFGMKFYLGDNVALRAAIGGGTSTVSTPRAGDTTGKTDDVHDIYFGVAPALGELQRFTPTIEALVVPDIDLSLDEAPAKTAFWNAFKAVGPWWAELPPY